MDKKSRRHSTASSNQAERTSKASADRRISFGGYQNITGNGYCYSQPIHNQPAFIVNNPSTWKTNQSRDRRVTQTQKQSNLEGIEEKKSEEEPMPEWKKQLFAKKKKLNAEKKGS